MKKVTYKILIACAAAFLVILVGFVAIAFGLRNISESYKSLSEGIEYTTHMDKIRKLVNEEFSAGSFYVLATSDEVLALYEIEEQNIKDELSESLNEFGNLMRGNEKEQIFQRINSGCVSVFNEISIAMNLKRNGSKTLAEQYITENLVHSKNNLNQNLDELSEYIEKKLEDAQVEMTYSERISNISFFVTATIVLCSFAAFTLLCLTLTSQLEHNRNLLQIDVDRKSEKITEQNQKIIYIQEQTIYGLANIIESRDNDTGGHVKRTSLYVGILATAAYEHGYYPEIITPEYIELLKKAAPMHDIGKITIPDSILKKTGKLSKEEYKIMQSHTVAGGKIIRDVLSNIETEDYVNIAADIATSHHERWDGHGYPFGLQGEEIPISARIMSIADVFDALVSPRCYKDPFSAEEAFNVIKVSKGIRFDPVLTDLFLQKKAQVIEVMQNNQDK